MTPCYKGLAVYNTKSVTVIKMSVSADTVFTQTAEEQMIRTSIAILDKRGDIIDDVDLNGGAPEKGQVYASAFKLYVSASAVQSYGDVEEIVVVYKKGAIKIMAGEDVIRVAASTGHTILT